MVGDNRIPEEFLEAEQKMLKYFDGGVKAYQVKCSEGMLTLTDDVSEYWADIELNKASGYQFCTDEEVPEEGMIRFSYGDRDWELVFINDIAMEEIIGVRQIRLVAFHKAARVSDY